MLARFGHALSDPTRSRLLLALRDGPAYPSDLADQLGVSRTNLSNHLACLRGCGLVVAVPEGRRSRYELADGRLQGVVSSGSDVERVYVSSVAAGTHGYHCSTNNNRPCGGLRGAPCKHLHALVDEAVVQYGADRVKTYNYNLGGNGKSQILKTAGFVKLVRVDDGPVVGVHMVGARVGELVGEAQLIFNWEAYPAEVAQLVHAHPTQSEALGEAHLALAGKPLHAHA